MSDRPRGKIIQIAAVEPGIIVCLCDDGSLWQHYTNLGRWKLLFRGA